MKRLIVCTVFVALMCVPLESALAAPSPSPPGLLRAQERTTANFLRQREGLEQRQAQRVARFEALIRQALLVRDIEAVGELEDALAAENEHFDQKVAQLQAKLAEKEPKFQAKIDAWIAEHGDSEAGSGDDGDIPPPPESPEQPQ